MNQDIDHKLIESLYSYSASNHFELSSLNPSVNQLIYIIENTHTARLAFKAAWALEHKLEKDTVLRSQHYVDLCRIYMHSKNWSVLRSISKMMIGIAKSDSNQLLKQEAVLERSFTLIENPDCPIAVRSNIYDILYFFCNKHKDLILELKMIIQLDLEKIDSAAIRARSKIILRKLEGIARS